MNEEQPTIEEVDRICKDHYFDFSLKSSQGRPVAIHMGNIPELRAIVV